MKILFTNSENQDSKQFQTLLQDVTLAKSMYARMKGLLGRAHLNTSEGILLQPCSSIHCYFMKFSIDVIMVDKNQRVIGLRKSVQPNEWVPPIPCCESIIETSVGVIDQSGIKLGALIHVDT
ncbi:MAG TPA: DUF192 domain-containing protein [Pseudobdellovibrionaceae bacterium]|nr:DUF192 domain-containing protein [Pseudobdellovibrionaceae bacterium]